MASESDILELSDYIAVIKRRRGLLFSVALPLLAIAIALSLGLPDVFVADGLIRYSTAAISGELPEAPAGRQRAYIDLYIQGLTAAVLSRPVLDQLLLQMPQLIAPGETREDAMLNIIDRTRVEPVKMAILDPDSGRQRPVISEFAISFDGSDPVIAREVAAWLTAAFIGGNRAGLKMRAEAALQFYQFAAAGYARQLTRLQSELARFKAQHADQLPEVTAVNLEVLNRTQRDLDNTTQRLRTLQQQKIYLEAQLSRAHLAGANAGLLGELQREYARKLATFDPNHPDMLGLRARIDGLRASQQAGDTLSIASQLQSEKSLLALMRQRYSDEHPDVRRIQREIESLEAGAFQVDASAARRAVDTPSANPAVIDLVTRLNATDTELNELEQGEGTLRAKLGQLELRLDQSPLIEHEYRTLQGDLQAAHAKYDDLSRTALALEVTVAAIARGHSDELRLVRAPATPQGPSKPRRVLIAAAGTLLAVVLGMTAVILCEAIDPKIRGRRDVYRSLREWPLVAIPEINTPARARHLRRQSSLIAVITLVASAAAVIIGEMFYK